jgi:benzoyl-CoA reductase/2-hydroxyglutaryl-CoA dehydratase subunit BcrC/BadD/HgdB
MKNQMDFLKVNKDSKAIARLFDLVLSYIERADAAHAEGRKVVYGGGLFDAPLIYSYDTFPCVYTELGRLASNNSLFLAEDYFQVPRETCSMVKATLGELFRRKSSFKRMIGYCSFCEPYNTAFEVLKGEDFNVHFVDLPYRPDHLNEERFKNLLNHAVKEFKSLGEWLGGEIDEGKISKEIKRSNEIKKKVWKILELQKKVPYYMGSLDSMFLITGGSHYYGDPVEYNTICDLLIEELEHEASHPKPIKKLPVVWAGGRGQEFGTYKLIDDLGGFISGWTLAGMLLRYYDETLPPLESIAYNSVIGMGGPGGARDWIPYIERLRVESNAKGIIFYGYFGCSFSSVNFEIAKNYFADKNIPGIILEGSFQVGEPSGQTVTRVKAFMEMLS